MIKEKINMLIKISKISGKERTMGDVRKLIGMSHATYTRKRGEDFYIDDLELIADMFGVSVLFFFEHGDADMRVLQKYIK